MKKKFILSICQMKVCDDKNLNISKAQVMIGEAAKNGAELIVLPEMFNCPYDNGKFPEYAEDIREGNTIKAICKTAGENNVYIAAGSIPEVFEGKLYNTCVFIGREGKIISKHRKVHLFDIDVEGQIRFKESDVLSSGNQITIIDTDLCKIGIAICFDIRFPELFRLMALKGAELILVPGAFNMVTGPAHWELLVRTRAVDNQLFVAAASPARDTQASYVAYGNSIIAEPWGEILKRAGEGEEIIYSEIDLEKLEKVRSQLPLLKNRRHDLYEVNEITDRNK